MGTLGGTGNIWGAAARAAVEAVSIPQDRVMTPAEKDAVWNALCGAHVTHITSNNVISTTVATIVATPDTLTGTGAGTGTGVLT